MTTSSNPAQTPTEAEASVSELSELWRAIGRLEGTAAALLEGQRELREGQEALRTEMREGQEALRTEFREGQEALRTEFREGQEALRMEFREGQEALRTEFRESLREVRTENSAALREGLQEVRTENSAALREVHRRIDRAVYVVLGVGGALLAALLATNFIGS